MTTVREAKGWSGTGGKTVKIAVTMSREDFDAVREKALAKGWSISEVIREYVNTGIFVDKECGEWFDVKDEPVCVLDMSRTPILRELLGIETEPPKPSQRS